jgi:hypothetical protein
MDEDAKAYEAEMVPLFRIFIGEIIIDDTTSVTIFGYLPGEDDELLRCDFVCKMHQLTDILLHAGPEGEALINIISKKLTEDFDGLMRVNAENLFNKPLEVADLVFVVYEGKEVDDEGNFVTAQDFFYFIDNIQELDDYLTNGIRESEPETLTAEEELEDAIVSLLNSYKHYLRLIESGDTETEAREGSTLTDHTLFDLAELYYKIRSKSG